jgi:hypothetical protein
MGGRWEVDSVYTDFSKVFVTYSSRYHEYEAILPAIYKYKQNINNIRTPLHLLGFTIVDIKSTIETVVDNKINRIKCSADVDHS